MPFRSIDTDLRFKYTVPGLKQDMADEQTAPITAFEPVRPQRTSVIGVVLTYFGEIALLLGQALREIARGRLILAWS